MTRADEIRDAQRATWAGLASSWEKWDACIMDQLAPVSEVMVDALGVTAAQHHLDLASGTGEPGLTIARRAPRGRVVLTDLVPEMLAVATRRAAALGIGNVDTRVCSADALPFDDATFDSVTVRFGYMFFPDLAAVTAEVARVLRPGGRVAASVWVKPDANPWTSLVMDAIATEVALAPPDPTGPNMFRCAAPGFVRALFEDAGLRVVDERDVTVELVTGSPEEYWDVMCEHVSIVSAALRRVDEPARAHIRAAAIDRVGAFARNGAIRVPGTASCTTGEKPAPR